MYLEINFYLRGNGAGHFGKLKIFCLRSTFQTKIFVHFGLQMGINSVLTPLLYSFCSCLSSLLLAEEMYSRHCSTNSKLLVSAKAINKFTAISHKVSVRFYNFGAIFCNCVCVFKFLAALIFHGLGINTSTEVLLDSCLTRAWLEEKKRRSPTKMV